MADYFTNYAQALEKAAADNMYNDLAGISGSLGNSVLQLVTADAKNPVDSRQYDTADSILYGALSGLITGGLSELGQQQQAEDLGAAQKVMLGLTTEKPEGLPTSLYSKASTYRDLIKQRIAQDIADEQRGMRNDILKDSITGQNADIRKLGMIPLEMKAEEDALASLTKGDMKDSGGEAPGATSEMRSPLTRAGKAMLDLEDTYYNRITKILPIQLFQTFQQTFLPYKNYRNLIVLLLLLV